MWRPCTHKRWVDDPIHTRQRRVDDPTYSRCVAVNQASVLRVSFTPMSGTFPFQAELPATAGAAVAIVRKLVGAGHQALLAGGCVRDLLLGRSPQDYDVATDAPPERVCELFRSTRKVGAQFGVVLVRQRRRWIEVATFRTDGPYLDGRRPAEVRLSDARHDALRRDFTVNGMFLDPLAMKVVDYVGGQADLEARVIRAIGKPEARFEEDHLRLLRAVRFAARLDFPIEPVTLTAIRGHAAKLMRVAAERVREELEKMLGHPSRRRAWSLLVECGLLPYLWAGASWQVQQRQAVGALLERLPPEAPFELALATLLADRSAREIGQVARALTLSNDQSEMTAWLVAHSGELDDPDAPDLAALKRLMANRAFGALHMLAQARYADMPDGTARGKRLEVRLAAIAPDAVQPPPLVKGDDLKARGIEPGPVYAEILGALYTQQLDEVFSSREEALRALDQMLRERG
jgi:poly(A) polymerase